MADGATWEAWAVVYSPSGERLAFVGEDGRVRVLDAESTRESGANRPPNSVTPLLPPRRSKTHLSSHRPLGKRRATHGG